MSTEIDSSSGVSSINMISVADYINGVGPLLVLVAAIAFAAYLVKICWNGSLSKIFNLPNIDIRQALMLLILVAIAGAAWRGTSSNELGNYQVQRGAAIAK